MTPEEARRRMAEIKRHGRGRRIGHAALIAKNEAGWRQAVEAAEALGCTLESARVRLHKLLGTTIWKGDQKQ